VKSLRKLFYKLFGLKNYLRLISRVYLTLIKIGLLKNKYPELFYLKKIIKPGYYCIDIGANLGYYSFFLSYYTGKNGKVIAVEPVPVFQEIWKENVKKTSLNNLELYPFALGSENKPIQLSMPKINGVIHHGMTRINTSQNMDIAQTFKAEMRIADELFINLKRLDFIKCDVEGYEYFVLSNMLNTIKRFNPLIQCELGTDLQNRKQVISLLENYGYKTYILKNEQLILATENDKINWPNDFYFNINKPIN
jgi:FkbM family methyltransferase